MFTLCGLWAGLGTRAVISTSPTCKVCCRCGGDSILKASLDEVRAERQSMKKHAV